MALSRLLRNEYLMDYRKHRFNEVLAEAGIKKADVTKITGLASGYLSEIASGKKPLTHSVIETICDKFKGIEPWMFFISPKVIPTGRDAELISRFSSLDDEGKDEIWKAIEFQEYKKRQEK